MTKDERRGSKDHGRPTTDENVLLVVLSRIINTMVFDLKILPTDLLNAYTTQVGEGLNERIAGLSESELSSETFSFYTSVSAVFSSKIEGENVELDSFVKHKKFGTEYLPDYTRKTDDLYNAYQFAKENKISRKNIEQAHALLTENILPANKRGKISSGKMYVTAPTGKIEYVAASPFALEADLEKFYADIIILQQSVLNIQEIFFFASIIHLLFVKIHPFDDGNGRISRLLEKWFLAEKLGPHAWFIQSEKHYYVHHALYYTNLRRLGLEYEALDYLKALPFLLMLPASLDSDFRE